MTTMREIGERMHLDAELRHWFSFHPPPRPEVANQHEAARAASLELARKLVELTPPGLERDRALQAVREAMFWANAGIACGSGGPAGDGKPEEPEPEPPTPP